MMSNDTKTAPVSATRLLSFPLTCPPLRSLGNVTTVDCYNAREQLVGFKLCIRGPMISLISPRGYQQGIARNKWNQNGPRRIWDIPRNACICEFESSDEKAADSIVKFDSHEFTRPTAAVESEAEPPPAVVGDE